MSPPLSFIPEVIFQTMKKGRPSAIGSHEVFSGRSVALFGLLGAFTPSCHHVYLPEIIAECARYRANGIDLVACTAVNDIHILDAWANALDISDEILFLADGNGDFARALGLIFDGRALGLGFRSRRYAMWLNNGVIQHLAVEPDPTEAEISGAYVLLRVFETWSEARAVAPTLY